MAMGMTRREQWALIGVAALIALGLAVEAWRGLHPDDPIVTVPGQGRWEKLADYPAGGHPQTLTTNTLARLAAPGATPRAGDPQAGGLDLNRATLDELDRLPGIGPAKAKAIIDTRERLGGFRSVEQLDDVTGIGAKTLERLRPYVKVEGAAATSASQAAAPPAGARPPAMAGTLPTPARAPAVAKARPTARAAVAGSPLPLVNINTAAESELLAIKGIGPVIARRIVEERQLHGPFRTPQDLDARIKGIGPANLQKMLPQITLR